MLLLPIRNKTLWMRRFFKDLEAKKFSRVHSKAKFCERIDLRPMENARKVGLRKFFQKRKLSFLVSGKNIGLLRSVRMHATAKWKLTAQSTTEDSRKICFRPLKEGFSLV